MDEVVGKITNPLPGAYQNIEASGGGPGGLILFFTNVVRLAFVVGGIWAFINFIIAGFQYMSAGGDAKSLESAWARIWQSLLGMVIMVGSFALAALIGQLFFGSATAILSPTLYEPK